MSFRRVWRMLPAIEVDSRETKGQVLFPLPNYKRCIMIKLKVSGMTCEHCEKAVEKALSEVPGVDQVIEVNRDRNEAVVEGQADEVALLAAVREEGYDAELVE